MQKQHFEVDGYGIIEKIVAEAGTTGRILAPKSWIGRKVTVILTELINEQKSKRKT